MAQPSYINMDIADAIIERPQPFEVDGIRFFLYPPTLGHTIIIERHVSALNINMEELRTDPYKTALRACIKQPGQVSRIVVLHTCRTKKEIFDDELIEKRLEHFKDVEAEDLAPLLLIILTRYTTEGFIKHLRLDKERQDKERVRRCKKSKGSYTFGGKSLYGTVIDYACERYGWTMNYVVWGISYQNLQMLMEDAVQSIYLTEEEQKGCHVQKNDDGERISGDDINSVERLAQLLNG